MRTFSLSVGHGSYQTLKIVASTNRLTKPEYCLGVYFFLAVGARDCLPPLNGDQDIVNKLPIEIFGPFLYNADRISEDNLSPDFFAFFAKEYFVF